MSEFKIFAKVAKLQIEIEGFLVPRIVAIAESYIDTNASVFRNVPACSKIRRLKNPIVFMEKHEFEPTDGMKCLRWVGNTELIIKSSCNVFHFKRRFLRISNFTKWFIWNSLQDDIELLFYTNDDLVKGLMVWVSALQNNGFVWGLFLLENFIFSGYEIL